MTNENVRKAIRTGIIWLRETPEDSIHRQAIYDMIYDLSPEWHDLIVQDIHWAWNLVYDDRYAMQAETAWEYEGDQMPKKPVFGIIVLILAVAAMVALMFSK